MSDRVTNRRPSAGMLRVMNAVLRRLLPSRMGARIPVGMIRFTGRRTGRRYEIPVGPWPVSEGMVVFTDAPWLNNFAGGRDAELVYRGRTERVVGQVVDDPARVGAWMRGVLATGVKPSYVGISLPPGHTLTDEEAGALRKAVLLSPKAP